jgi:hypothetical protein
MANLGRALGIAVTTSMITPCSVVLIVFHYHSECDSYLSNGVYGFLEVIRVGTSRKATRGLFVE